MSAETVFLSYVAEDRALAGRLKSDLARAGVTVVDRASLTKPGYRVKAAVKQAIESASYFVLCLSSRDGLPPAYAKDEVALALAAGRSIVPVRFTRCDIPALDESDAADDLGAADLYDDWRFGIDQLAAVLPVAPRSNEQAASNRIVIKTKGRFDTGGLHTQAMDTTIEADGGVAVTNIADLGAPK